jgi:hypothetical protein
VGSLHLLLTHSLHTAIVETAVSVAIIGASAAIIIVAGMLVVALGYVVFILRHVADSVQHLKKAARTIGKDVSGAVHKLVGGGAGKD